MIWCFVSPRVLSSPLHFACPLVISRVLLGADCSCFEFEPVSDLRFVTPILVALQMNDANLGCLALESLDALIANGFFSKISARGAVRHSTALAVVLRALAASMSQADQNYQTAAINVCLRIESINHSSMTIADLFFRLHLSLLLPSLFAPLILLPSRSRRWLPSPSPPRPC